MTIFDRIFGKKAADTLRATVPGLSDEDIQAMDYFEVGEVIDYYFETPYGPPSNIAISAYRRLIDIGMLERDIAPEIREESLKLADILNSLIEAMFAGRPESLNAFNNAKAAQMEQIRLFGRGSALWGTFDLGE